MRSRWKNYECSACGNVKSISTNHFGPVYDYCGRGDKMGCSWKGYIPEGQTEFQTAGGHRLFRYKKGEGPYVTCGLCDGHGCEDCQKSGLIQATSAKRMTNIDKIKNYLENYDTSQGTAAFTGEERKPECEACGKKHSDVSLDVDPRPNWRVDGTGGTKIDEENLAYWIPEDRKQSLRYSPAASIHTWGTTEGGPADTVHQEGFDTPSTPFHIKVLWNPYVHERDHATMNLLHEAGHYMQAKSDWDTFHAMSKSPGKGIHGDPDYERDAWERGVDVARQAGVRVTPNMREQWRRSVGGEHLSVKTKWVDCHYCEGTGTERICGACRGWGGTGPIDDDKTCGICKGSGEGDQSQKCRNCKGSGLLPAWNPSDSSHDPKGCEYCEAGEPMNHNPEYRQSAVREKNVRCPDCQEKHDPTDACAPVTQQMLPLWDKKAGMDDEYFTCPSCEGGGCKDCHGSGLAKGIPAKLTGEEGVCRHCQRRILYDENHGWIDPEATGDDRMWRETCDAHEDDIRAEHEPESYHTKQAGFEWVAEFEKTADEDQCAYCSGDSMPNGVNDGVLTGYTCMECGKDWTYDPRTNEHLKEAQSTGWEQCYWCDGSTTSPDCAYCAGKGERFLDGKYGECGPCKGTGDNPLPDSRCQLCGGAGLTKKIAEKVHYWGYRNCNACGGKGCSECKGSGMKGIDCPGCAGTGEVYKCPECSWANAALAPEDKECPNCGAERELVPCDEDDEDAIFQKNSAYEQCQMCEGSGTNSNCPKCLGVGDHWNAAFSDRITCRTCGGNGQGEPRPCNQCSATGIVNTRIPKKALFDYDPVRDVQPSGGSAPAPSAQGQGGDPWPDQGDNGTAPPRSGPQRDKKLKKWIMDEQLTYPDVGPTFPGVTDINKVGKNSHKGDSYIPCWRCEGDPENSPWKTQLFKGQPSTCITCKGTGLLPNTGWHHVIHTLKREGFSPHFSAVDAGKFLTIPYHGPVSEDEAGIQLGHADRGWYAKAYRGDPSEVRNDNSYHDAVDEGFPHLGFCHGGGTTCSHYAASGGHYGEFDPHDMLGFIHTMDDRYKDEFGGRIGPKQASNPPTWDEKKWYPNINPETGKKKAIQPCPQCDGTTVDTHGSVPQPCTFCKGSGLVNYLNNSMLQRMKERPGGEAMEKRYRQNFESKLAGHMDPTGYTYDAAHHCTECAEERFGKEPDHPWIREDAEDSEGNEPSPIFSHETESPQNCDSCGENFCTNCGEKWMKKVPEAPCDECEGVGKFPAEEAKPGGYSQCEACDGSGSEYDPLKPSELEKVRCRSCKGSGIDLSGGHPYIPEETCTKCEGAAKIREHWECENCSTKSFFNEATQAVERLSQVFPQPVGMHEADNGIDDPKSDADKSKIRDVIPGTQRSAPGNNVWNVSVDNMPKTGRKWTRQEEEEVHGFFPGSWAHRVYTSEDGWKAERSYSPGDRYLNRPTTQWEVSHKEVPDGWGSNPMVATLAEAKAFPESEDGATYLNRGKPKMAQAQQAADVEGEEEPEEPQPTDLQLHVLKNHPMVPEEALMDPELDAIHLMDHFEGQNDHNPEVLIVA